MLHAATRAPARLIGGLGSLRAGGVADVAVLHDLPVVRTVKDGTEAFAAG